MSSYKKEPCQFSFEDLCKSWELFDSRRTKHMTNVRISQLWSEYTFIRDTILLYKNMIPFDDYQNAHKSRLTSAKAKH